MPSDFWGPLEVLYLLEQRRGVSLPSPLTIESPSQSSPRIGSASLANQKFIKILEFKCLHSLIGSLGSHGNLNES